jgi:hypothetical protein
LLVSVFQHQSLHKTPVASDPMNKTCLDMTATSTMMGNRFTGLPETIMHDRKVPPLSAAMEPTVSASITMEPARIMAA